MNVRPLPPQGSALPTAPHPDVASFRHSTIISLFSPFVNPLSSFFCLVFSRNAVFTVVVAIIWQKNAGAIHMRRVCAHTVGGNFSFSEAFYEKSEAVMGDPRHYGRSGNSRRGGCRDLEQSAGEALAVVQKGGKNPFPHRLYATVHRNCGRAVGGVLTGAVPFGWTAPLFCIFFRFLLPVYALANYGNNNCTDSVRFR